MPASADLHKGADAPPPLATFAIMAYNQEAYIERALQAAFSQEYEPLEIVVSDDASTDRTAEIIRSVVARYDGPHSIVVNVNPSNLGIGAHVNRLFRIAKGNVVVLAGGDDTSLPQRTSKVMERWSSTDPHPSAIYCGARKLSPEGHDMGTFVSEIARGPRDAEHVILFKDMKRMLAIGACGAYDAGLMRVFGELDDDLPIEDIPLIARACMAQGLAYVDEDLVLYRSNVSVWRPRKVAGDTFERRVHRRRFYTLARLKVARQVLSDAISTRNPTYVSAALRAYALHDFVHDACARQQFSARRYLWVALASRNWMYPFVAGMLDGHPRIHRFLFWIKHAFVQPAVLRLRGPHRLPFGERRRKEDAERRLPGMQDGGVDDG